MTSRIRTSDPSISFERVLQSGASGALTVTVNGDITVTGDLLVSGVTTTLNTTNLDVEDNIILLNRGETGVGVTEGQSGIEIDRGVGQNRPRLIWDETRTAWSLGQWSAAPQLTPIVGLADPVSPDSAVTLQYFNTTIGAAGYLSNVVEDLTPQLGGNLDVNGKTITSTGSFVKIEPTGGVLEIGAVSGTSSAVVRSESGRQLTIDSVSGNLTLKSSLTNVITLESDTVEINSLSALPPRLTTTSGSFTIEVAGTSSFVVENNSGISKLYGNSSSLSFDISGNGDIKLIPAPSKHVYLNNIKLNQPSSVTEAIVYDTTSNEYKYKPLTQSFSFYADETDHNLQLFSQHRLIPSKMVLSASSGNIAKLLVNRVSAVNVFFDISKNLGTIIGSITFVRDGLNQIEIGTISIPSSVTFEAGDTLTISSSNINAGPIVSDAYGYNILFTMRHVF